MTFPEIILVWKIIFKILWIIQLWSQSTTYYPHEILLIIFPIVLKIKVFYILWSSNVLVFNTFEIQSNFGHSFLFEIFHPTSKVEITCRFNGKWKCCGRQVIDWTSKPFACQVHKLSMFWYYLNMKLWISRGHI